MTDTTESGAWLPEGFEHPTRVELVPGYHLRPIRATDVDLDYPAVMGSRERLWSIYGDAWGWPLETMSYEADRDDLAMHEREIADHVTFNYAILDDDAPLRVGCDALGLPIGLQLLGDAWDEATIFAAGGHLERIGVAVPRRPRVTASLLG